jgi:multicomponent K+:H+ antiporter subunit G
MSDLPLWAAALVSVTILSGAFLTLLGCLGLLRFSSFYARVHAPTLGTSMGMVGVAVASMIYFSVSGQRLVIHEVLILVMVTLTTPVTLMLLARAALYRDRSEGKPGIPSPRAPN